MNKWSDKEVEWLRKNHDKTMNKKEKYLKRTKCAILAKQQRLGIIRKSVELNSGDIVNFWTLKERFIKNGSSYFVCKCKCGVIKNISRQSLVIGSSKSCGCFAQAKKTKHGLAYDKIYKTWQSIKERCYSPNCLEYKNYGARGIRMFKGWLNDPQSFCNYINSVLGSRPPKHSLDRIDNDKDYEPGNLRWANQSTQIRNSRTAKLVEKDVLKIKEDLRKARKVSDISRQYNMSVSAIYAIKYGYNWKGVN